MNKLNNRKNTNFMQEKEHRKQDEKYEQDKQNEQNTNSKINSNNFNPIIRNSLEYYDSYQPKIQQILDKIEYIKIVDGGNINDEYIFYDSNDKPFFKSRIETLGMFVPQDNTWRWSWSIPFAKYQNTLISRKILEYAFTLNSDNDLNLKSTLINSKLIIMNQYQIDIYLALASMLSKKPFVLKLYIYPMTKNPDSSEKIIYYKKIISNSDRKNFISIYILMIDWNN